MAINHNEAIDRLKTHGIKTSVQRVEILHYLMEHPIHPTVDDVYKSLLPYIPTLSRTTVYNTLRMFSEHNVAQMITIDEHRVCYDGNMSLHAHFICKQCRKVYDIFDEVSEVISRRELAGHHIDDVQLYYKGICKECLSKQNNGIESR